MAEAEGGAGGRRRGPARRRPRARPTVGNSLVGQEYLLQVGPVAHGGMCVARHEGRVVFVRHALPGEQVRARVTEGRDRDRFLRADAVQILQPAADRVQPPCPAAGPGGCGGCDWQHASPSAQRRLKAAVLAEQLRRLAGLDRVVEVEALPGSADGAGWRTRVRFAVDAQGRAGLRGHRSSQVVPLSQCHIAHPAINASGVLQRTWPGVDEVAVTAWGAPDVQVSVSSAPASGASADTVESPIVETVAGRRFALPVEAFWQVHPDAPRVLCDAVRAALDPRPGDVLLDLYAGVGLFASVLAADVLPGGRVIAVEGDSAAAAAAELNLRDLGGTQVVSGRVDRTLAAGVGPVDLVVLDPPRTGAGREVVERLAALGARRIAYVACDPAALARDIATFITCGYHLADLRAFDLFPHTHHVEAVAVLEATGP